MAWSGVGLGGAGRAVGAVVVSALFSAVIGCGTDDSMRVQANQYASEASATSTVPAGRPTTQSAPTPDPLDGHGATAITSVLNGDATAWTGPELLGSINSSSMGAVVRDSRKLVHFERTGETNEGCEAETPAHRLVLSDFDSGQTQVLIPELPRNDQSIELGPHGRFAILGGCDANVWLAAVGSVQDGGAVDIVRLDNLPDERSVHGSNNAGVSTTWSPDGEVLYFNTARVDATTGARLDAPASDGPLQVYAQLVDGSRLVSHRGDSEPSSSFWLLRPDEPDDTVPGRAPLFGGEATYPSAEVELSGNGEGVAITLDRWSPKERTLLVTSQAVTELSGFASLSSDWSRALVRTGRQDGAPTQWALVDLASGIAHVVPADLVPGTVHEVAWAGDQRGLLLAASPDELQQDTSLQIWYTELTR